VRPTYLTPKLLAGGKVQLHGKAFYAGNDSKAILYIGSANFTGAGYGLTKGTTTPLNVEGGILIQAERPHEVQALRAYFRNCLSGEWTRLKPKDVQRGRSEDDRSQGEDFDVRMRRCLAARIEVRIRKGGVQELRVPVRVRLEGRVLDLVRIDLLSRGTISDSWQRGRDSAPTSVSLTLPHWSIDLHLRAHFTGLRSSLTLPLSHLIWNDQHHAPEAQSIFELLESGSEGSTGRRRNGRVREMPSDFAASEENDLRFPWASLPAIKKLIRRDSRWTEQARGDVNRRISTATDQRQTRKWSIVLKVLDSLNGTR